MKYLKIDGRFIEVADDYAIDEVNYPNAQLYTLAQMQTEINQPIAKTEAEKKADLELNIRQLISNFDYVFLGDTEGYITNEHKELVREYRQELRNILNDFALLSSAEIEARIPAKPVISHNKVV
jgi:predicted metallo-beta-lactamase superfamily hydrolase